MSVRKAAAAMPAAIALALALLPATAGAQTTTPATSLNNIPITGTVQNHKAFTGHFTVDRFATKHGSTYAVGTLKGTIGRRNVAARDVFIPVAVDRSGMTPGSTGSRSAAAAASCPVLHLTLGPLNLNLLGLTVHLNQVVLDITAVSGPGNLLGNLLCSVSHLLDTQTLASQQLAGLLNIVQQLVNVPGLLNL